MLPKLHPILITLLLAPGKSICAQETRQAQETMQTLDIRQTRETRQTQKPPDTLGNHYLTLSSAFDLAMANSIDIAVVSRAVAAARQQAAVTRQYHLPDVNASLSEGYLSNADTWNPSFADHGVTRLPHIATAFSVDADWTVLSGGRLKLADRQADLQETLAAITVSERKEAIKLFVAAKYLDVCRQLNRLQIYLDNTYLARRRLALIESLHRQGMVTRNDVLRTQIEINDFELAVRQTGNAVIRLNTALDVILGLPDSARLIPDTNLLQQPGPLGSAEDYLAAALRDNPSLALSRTETHAAALRVDQQKAERQPVLGIYAGTNLLRPYVYSKPAADIYYNVWQAGLSIRYDIGSLYKSNARIKESKLGLDVSRTRDTLSRQQIVVGVRNAYNLCRQSWDELETARRDVAAADENYRIVEEKYRNQLALITDLIDATDTRIQAQIRVNDAIIDTRYTYYQLLQLTGSL